MSSRPAGAGRGGEREAISESVKRTVQSIRETTGKQHSDEDILTVLEACSMDADETAQRLLYLDTFHEVKRKPRKETYSTQVRGTRGFGGNNFDGFGGRNPGPRRGNASNHKMNNSNAPITATRSSIVATDGSSSLREGSSSLESNMSLLANGDMKDGSVADGKKTPPKSLPVATPASTNIRSYSAVTQAEGKFTSKSNAHPVSALGFRSPASDLVLPQPPSTHHVAESQEKPPSVEENTSVFHKTEEPGKEDTATEYPLTTGKNDSSQSSSLPKQNGFLSTKAPSLDATTMEEMSIPLIEGGSYSPASTETTMTNGHVIFPNHFKVSQEVKSGLVFGNFGAKSGQETNSGNVDGVNAEPESAIDSAATSDEIAGELSNGSVSMVQVDQPSSFGDGQGLDSVSQGENNIVPVIDSKNDESKQEIGMVLEGQQVPLVQVMPSYNYSIMPQMGHLLQFEGHDTQAQDTSPVFSPKKDTSPVSTVVSESLAPASTSATPPAQINLATSPQPVLFRPPYHPSYFPYGPYFNPYFFPPMLHQFLSHNGLPPQQQSTANNPYLASAPNAAGIKIAIPHLKSGAGAGNPIPTGLPPMYSAYGSGPVGYNPGQTVTSGNSLSNGDSLAPQLKENHVYSTGPLSEVPSWVLPPGQEMSSMQLNSLYHLQAQGQHLAFPPPAQAGHGRFPGFYHPGQTMAAPSTVNQPIQQSQAVSSAAVESGGHPSTAYQQPQPPPVNWNNGY